MTPSANRSDVEHRTDVLGVPGAQLYYELRGTGPLLVLVPGAKGEADAYRDLATELAPRFQVLTYDRRGFSRSRLDAEQDHQHRLATDTADLTSLITHLGDQPATVFGNSSGAIVAMQLLTDHPDLVQTVVAHEPPTVNLLPDAATWRDFFDGVYDTYRTSGIPAAMREFTTGAFSDADRRAIHRLSMQPANRQYLESNASYWMEHELRQYPRVEPDIDTLAARGDRLVLAAGRESHGQVCYRTTAALATTLELDVLELPGGHLGCVTAHTEFAAELVKALIT